MSAGIPSSGRAGVKDGSPGRWHAIRRPISSSGLRHPSGALIRPAMRTIGGPSRAGSTNVRWRRWGSRGGAAASRHRTRGCANVRSAPITRCLYSGWAADSSVSRKRVPAIAAVGSRVEEALHVLRIGDTPSRDPLVLPASLIMVAGLPDAARLRDPPAGYRFLPGWFTAGSRPSRPDERS